MISRIAFKIQSSLLTRSIVQCCSNQQVNPAQKPQEEQERNVDPEQANPKLETSEQRAGILRNIWRVFVWTSFSAFVYNYYLLLYKNSTAEKEIGYENHFYNWAKQAHQSLNDSYDFFTKPPVDKLLPDMPQLPPGYVVPKTLVLNLTGTLVHMSYVVGKGAEVMKRPGLGQFLRKLSGMYEVVILTDDDTMTVHNIIERLDPSHQIFQGRFGRESLVFENGNYIKDLKYLNRDLSRVVVVDKNINKIKNQENCIEIQNFEGDENDQCLTELLPMLEYLAKYDIKDVRKEIKRFGNISPQKKFLEELKQTQATLQQNMKKGVTGVFSTLAQQKKSTFSDNRRI